MTPRGIRPITPAAPRTTERAFQAGVEQYARLCGWRVYHTHDSRRSEPGFPDLVMVRNGRLVFAELKTERGRWTAAQLDWLADLQAVEADCGPHVIARTWRPSAWPEIEHTLRRRST